MGGGLSQGEDFRVGAGIRVRLAAVVRAGKHAFAVRDDRAHRNLPFRKCDSRFLKRESHHLNIRFGKHYRLKPFFFRNSQERFIWPSGSSIMAALSCSTSA